jgi:hypothetical protein
MEAIERSQDKIARDEKRLREAAQILAIVYKAGADDSDLRRRIGRWLTDDEKELA